MDIVPSINTDQLQEAANAAAMKGAIAVINDYYTSYNSPYKKQIEEALKEKTVNVHFELPDIVGFINEKLVAEIDRIANAAVAQTYVPLIGKILARMDKVIKFSDLLEKFVETEFGGSEEDYDIDIAEETKYEWLNVKLKHDKKEVTFTLHRHTKGDEGKHTKAYKLLSLGHFSDRSSRTMKIEIEGGKIEMPFEASVLSDEFASYLASLVLSGSVIMMDQEHYSEDWFYKHNY